MATRTIKAGIVNGNWNAIGSWDEGAVPLAGDDVVARVDGTSGSLVINATAVCRSIDLTNYTSTLTHNTAISLTIGTSTQPPGNVAFKFSTGMTYSMPGAVTIAFSSSYTSNVQTIDFNNKTIGGISFSNTASYQFLNGFTANFALTLTNGTVDFNSKTITFATVSITGTNVRTLTLSNSTINLTGTGAVFTYSGSGLIISNNTATINFTGAGPTFNVISGTNFNGTSIIVSGAPGTFTISNSCIINNFILDPTTTKTITVTAGITISLTGTLYCCNTGGILTFGTAGTISKLNGTVNLYNITNTATVFTGGATWNTKNNCTISDGLGINELGGKYYIHPSLGDDTTVYAWGWYKVSYTDALGTMPIEDESVTGNTSNSIAKIGGLVNYVEWIAGSGTIWFQTKSAPFQSETVTCANGGTFNISGDFVNGAWKTINGATAVKISLLDEMRIAKSPAPVAVVGNTAKWTSSSTGLPTTKNIVISSGQTITVNNHGYSNADIIQITAHTGNTTANGSWIITGVTTNTFNLVGYTGSGIGGVGNARNINSRAVVLTSGNTLTIDNCETAWTPTNSSSVALTNVTTDAKQGEYCIQITAPASPAINTKYAYLTLSTLNLSAYQNISFWIKNQSAIVANNWNICLCSDVSGVTVVNSFAIPAIPSTTQWIPLNIALGVNLGASIKSIALYSGSVAPTASNYIRLDNIIACTSSGLNLQSILTQSNLDNNQDGWCIQSIDNTIILLDQVNNTVSTSGFAYYGTDGIVNTYIRSAYQTTMQIKEGASDNSLVKTGTFSQNIFYSFGYNTVTNIQDGATLYDGLNSWGNALYYGANNYNYITFSGNIGGFRYQTGLYLQGLNFIIHNGNITMNSCTYAGIRGVTCYLHTFNGNVIMNTSQVGVFLYYACNGFTFNGTLTCIGNISNGLQFMSNNKFNGNVLLANNIQAGIIPYSTQLCNDNQFNSSLQIYGNLTVINITGDNNIFKNLTTSGNVNGPIFQGNNILINPNISEGVVQTMQNYIGNITWGYNVNRTPNNHIGYAEGATIQYQTTGGYTANRWTVSITNTLRNSTYPVVFSLAKVKFNANQSVIVKCWIKKTHATNISASISCKGGFISGVTSDITTLKGNDTNWENVTLATMTPTVSGVLEITAQTWYVANAAVQSVDFSDVTISVI